MADNTKLILLAGAGAAVYWFYFRNSSAGLLTPILAAGGAPAAGGGTPASPAPPAPAAPPPATPSAPTLAKIEAATLAAANAPAAGLSIDEWGWYLNQALAPLGKAAPDPFPLFSDLPGFDRSMLVTGAVYWPRMEAALRSQLGLSGFHGLGFFGVVQ